jgi:hypothetical protein
VAASLKVDALGMNAAALRVVLRRCIIWCDESGSELDRLFDY